MGGDSTAFGIMDRLEEHCPAEQPQRARAGSSRAAASMTAKPSGILYIRARSTAVRASDVTRMPSISTTSRDEKPTAADQVALSSRMVIARPRQIHQTSVMWWAHVRKSMKERSGVVTHNRTGDSVSRAARMSSLTR